MFMRGTLAITSLAIAALALGQATAPTDKLTIKRAVKADAKTLYKVVAKIEVSGMDITAKFNMTAKAGTAVKEGMGMKAIFSDLVLEMGGDSQPNDDEQPIPDIDYVAKTDGTFANISNEGDGPESVFPRFILGMMSLPLPEKVGAGDKFKMEWAKDAAVPFGSATEEFEVVGLDTETPAKGLKIKFSLKGSANADSGPYNATGEMWVDPKNGEIVSLKAKFADLQVRGPVNGNVTVDRK